MGKHISVAATNQHTAMYTPTCERISYTIRLKASNNPNSEHRQFTANHDNLNNHANYNYMQLTPCISSVSLCSKHSARNYDISTLSLPKPNALTLSAQTRSFHNFKSQQFTQYHSVKGAYLCTSTRAA